jgi:2'-5' RNA ligase
MRAVSQRRLFFALLPGARARAALQALAHKHLPARGRVVPAADLHLTLAFLGSVPESLLPRLRAAIASVDAAPCGVVLDRLERWRGGLLCVTGAACPEIVELHEKLVRLAVEADVPVDVRAFRAHVTLARGLSGVFDTKDVAVAPISLRARSFCLMESRARGDGGHYRAVARRRLDKVGYIATQHIGRAALA